MEKASKYIPMAIYISDSLATTKNTEKEYSIGIIYPLAIRNKINMLSIMKVSGGEDYLMDKVFIIK